MLAGKGIYIMSPCDHVNLFTDNQAGKYQGCESISEKKSEKVLNNLKCLKRCAFQCIKSLKIGFCEEQKKSEIKLKSELSHPWNIRSCALRKPWNWVGVWRWRFSNGALTIPLHILFLAKICKFATHQYTKNWKILQKFAICNTWALYS